MNNRNYNKVPTDRSKVVKRAKKINISAKALEDFIWMSYRYCIGRHTIAAAYHANTIANVIASNPDAFSRERLAFNAKDIRERINDAIRFLDCYDIDSCFSLDAFSCALYKSAEVENPNEYIYHIEQSGYIELDAPKELLRHRFDQDYINLIPWVKLANWLDKSTHRMITVEYDGKVETYECFPYPQKMEDGKYRKMWANVEDADMIHNRWIAEEYITKIEDIDNGDKN